LMRDDPDVKAVLQRMETLTDDVSKTDDASKAMQAELGALGIDPKQVDSKVMGDPELMSLMMKPSVAKAMQQLEQDPGKAEALMRDDADVKVVFEKLYRLTDEVLPKNARRA
jgi:hypothetical protein